MPPAVRSALQRFTGVVREFTIAQRTLAIIGIAVVVVGAIALTAWLTRPQYSMLFSGLQPADASAIVDQLKKNGVPYELSDGGATILVPDSQVYDQRLAAASAGLPKATGQGYSLLDQMGVTSSDFQQNVTYKRAIEGELANTIDAIDGVSNAAVHLAIPQQTVFVSEKQPPTASVFVQTDAGKKLSNDQVQAIVHLTSAAVDGLTPDNVTVVDGSGNVLSAAGVGAGSAQDAATDQEARIQTAVQQMLNQVVGPGKSTVAVTVSTSGESAQRTSETFSQPQGDVPPLTQDTTTQNYTGTGGTAAGGTLGPDNIAVPNGGDGEGTFDSTQNSQTNAVDKVTETRQIPAGAVTRQTVSVAIDSAAAGSLTAAEITSLVNAAAGIDPARGDSVAVQFVPFSTEAADAAAAALAQQQQQNQQEQLWSLVRAGAVALGVVAVLIVLVVFLVRSRRRRASQEIDLGTLLPAAPEAIAASPVEAKGLAEKQGSASIEAPTVPLPVAPEDVIEPPALPRTVRDEINAWAVASPDRTVESLRALIGEREQP